MDLSSRLPGPETGVTSPSSAGAGGNGLLVFADRMFGDDDVRADPRAGRWWLRYLGVAGLLAAIIVARRPDAVTNPQFFGEDGFLFFREDLLYGLRAMTRPYMGFPQLAQRMIGTLG